jgi:uncharacterized phage infection (PIP) family protein YhgE
MTKKVRKFANGGALSDIIGAMPKFGGPIAGIGGGAGVGAGGGGGSAKDGLGQVNQGSQTIDAALQRAQQSNAAAASAAEQAKSDIGGGLGPSTGSGTFSDGYGGASKQIDDMPKYTGTPAPSGYQSSAGLKKGGTVKKYAKGGRISLDACGVSTHKPAKKNANW